jgi:hypothetical protein
MSTRPKESPVFTPVPGRLTNSGAWRERLPADLVESLEDWLARQPFDLTHQRWLLGGLSGSLLAIVLVQRHHGMNGGAVLKLIPPTRADIEALGVATLRGSSPKDFAERHLVATTDTHRLPNGWDLHLQDVAHVDTASLAPLVTLIDHPNLAEQAAAIITSMVNDWQPADDPRPVRRTVASYLSEHLRAEVSGDGGLTAFAHLTGLDLRPPGEEVTIPGRPGRLPNPLMLLSDDGPGALELTIHVGNGHGDLNLANVLVPVRPEVRPEQYLLIDLGLFSPTLPIGQDAVKLLLSMAEPWFAGLVPGSAIRSSLAELLVHPSQGSGGAPVRGYRRVAEAVVAANASWATRRGLVADVERQYPLILLAEALRMAAKARLPMTDRWWFFEVAALAARALIEFDDGGQHPPTQTEPSTKRITEDAPPPAAPNGERRDRPLPPPVRPGAPTYPGEARLAFVRGLGDAWRDLVTVLNIPPYDVARFAPGDEARRILEWLEIRARLTELHDALLVLGRDDLATTLGSAERPFAG